MLGQRRSSLLVQCRSIVYDADPTLLQHWVSCLLCAAPQQTGGIHPMLFQCWPIVFDTGPTLKKHHWVIVPCLLGLWHGIFRDIYSHILCTYILNVDNVDPVVWLGWKLQGNFKFTLKLLNYSRTCYEQPPLWHRKTGLEMQVAAHRRFICIQNGIWGSGLPYIGMIGGWMLIRLAAHSRFYCTRIFRPAWTMHTSVVSPYYQELPSIN